MDMMCPALIGRQRVSTSEQQNALRPLGHETDIHRLDRVITVSAAQALEELNHKASRFVSTNLDELDLALASGAADFQADGLNHGGVRKGQVTEVWGPPGIGKT